MDGMREPGSSRKCSVGRSKRIILNTIDGVSTDAVKVEYKRLDGTVGGGEDTVTVTTEHRR